MKKILLLSVVLLSSLSQVSAQSKSFNRLCTWLEGSFNSTLQAQQDSDFFDIRLHITRIWKENKDGAWFYVEQAVVTAQEKPYRQRVYHVTQLNDTVFESAVYTFPTPLRFAGAWKNGQLGSITSDSLSTRKGCSVFIKARGKALFEGGTNERDCESDLRGAKYATTNVKLTKERLESWDQGFDAEGKQVWGATKGGYVFIRDEK